MNHNTPRAELLAHEPLGTRPPRALRSCGRRRPAGAPVEAEIVAVRLSDGVQAEGDVHTSDDYYDAYEYDESQEPVRASLEDSLSQIERLSAELQELTELTTIDEPRTPSADVRQDPSDMFDDVRPPRPAPHRPFRAATNTDYETLQPPVFNEPYVEPVSNLGMADEPQADTPHWTATECEAPRPVLAHTEQPPSQQFGLPRSEPDVSTHLTEVLPPLPRVAPASTSVLPTAPYEPWSAQNIGGGPTDPPQYGDGPYEESEPPRNRRKMILVVAAALLAIPAFALGAVQPWLDDSPSDDKVTLAGRERANQLAEAGGQPNPAVANTHDAPIGADDHDRPGGEVAVREREGRGAGAGRREPTPTTEVRRGDAKGLSASVSTLNTTPTVGDELRFTIEWTDGQGQLAGTRQQWGDGTPDGGAKRVRECSQDALDSSGALEARHVFTKPGTYTVQITVTTFTCDGSTESQTVPLVITVAAKPSATPSSPPSSPAPTGTPTNSPSQGTTPSNDPSPSKS